MWHFSWFPVWILVAFGGSVWHFYLGDAARLKRSVRASDVAMRSRVPGETSAVFSIWNQNTQAGTTELHVVLCGGLTARIPSNFSFDLDVPLDAMRTLRGSARQRAMVSMVRTPTPDSFAAFLRSHIRVAPKGLLPGDVVTLSELQGAVWASSFASGWPVLCPYVVFVCEESLGGLRKLPGELVDQDGALT